MERVTSKSLTSFLLASAMLFFIFPARASAQSNFPFCGQTGVCYSNVNPVAAPVTNPPTFIQLSGVPLMNQSLDTSCGEAAFAMVYNYAFPETPLSEWAVIQTALSDGWYLEWDPTGVFTSPAHLTDIGVHYAGTDATAGNVSLDNQQAAKQSLYDLLKQGTPVIVDVNVIVGDTYSSTHFVVVTGIDLQKNTVSYNDPYGYNPDGIRQAARRVVTWASFWSSWSGNSDPNGAGWFMTIIRH